MATLSNIQNLHELLKQKLNPIDLKSCFSIPQSFAPLLSASVRLHRHFGEKLLLIKSNDQYKSGLLSFDRKTYQLSGFLLKDPKRQMENLDSYKIILKFIQEPSVGVLQ